MKIEECEVVVARCSPEIDMPWSPKLCFLVGNCALFAAAAAVAFLTSCRKMVIVYKTIIGSILATKKRSHTWYACQNPDQESYAILKSKRAQR